MTKKAIIIGGGIGGLSTAIALGRIGIETAIYERAHELREIGAGLLLWPNALKALAKLDLEQAVMDAGVPITHNRLRSPRGRLMSERSLMAAMKHAYGRPTIGLHRAALQSVLLGKIDASTIQLGAECVAVSQDAGGVEARFADGRSARGDFLIGADGINSVVRKHLFGDIPLRFSGFVGWRGVVTFDHYSLLEYSAFESMGRGLRFGGFHIAPRRIFWFAGMNTEPGREVPQSQRKDQLRAMFRDWYSPIPELIEATSADAILHHDLYDLPPLERWTTGRITLLGDAAHAMNPRLGQGACLAFEDAVALAECVRKEPDVAAALQSYEARRLERARAIVELSLKVGRLMQNDNPVVGWLRDVLLSRVPVSAHLKRMGWIFGYEP